MNSGVNADDSGRGEESSGGRKNSADDRTTGLPGLRTWGAVYTFVLVLFAVYIVLLIALERMFP